MTSLPASTRVGAFTLAVASLDRAVDFYANTLGIPLIARENGSATLGVDETPLVMLDEKPGAIRQPRWSTGLYHAAILLPTRADLGRLIIHLAQTKYPLSGYADHLVSEAFYLNDPDGNGLELYRDRPRADWPMMDGGMVRMDNAPIDFDDFFADAEREGQPWRGMPSGTVVGHMHLKVGSDTAARDFYRDVIGFDVMAYFPGAAFESAGGYHHHLGMNAWESRGAGPAPSNAAGLVEWSIVLPDTASLDAVAERAEAANALIERTPDQLVVADPWGTRARLIVG